MWTLEQIDQFEEIIDVRAPSEYETDHILRARNFPVLENDERIEVGTLYRQSSSFEAKKLASHMITSNISNHLREHFNSRDANWQPLIYCWRGGSRSHAFTYILRQIGWDAIQLPGGYKAYRKMVIQETDNIAPRLLFKVLCGRTGVGKSFLLQALKQKNAQVLDLEALANHRGSVLGNPVHGQQPMQKRFENLLCDALRHYDPNQTIFVEAESRKIGKLQIPNSLLTTMRNAPCINIKVPLPARVRYLISEYRHFLEDKPLLETALSSLLPFQGRKKIDRWTNWEEQIGAEQLVRELLEEHYDPIYLRSMQQHFMHYPNAQAVKLTTLDHAHMEITAEQLMREEKL